MLKEAAKTRKVPKEEILSALSVMEKQKLDSSTFLETLGGTQSPGKTWMLIFTAEVHPFLLVHPPLFNSHLSFFLFT